MQMDASQKEAQIKSLLYFKFSHLSFFLLPSSIWPQLLSLLQEQWALRSVDDSFKGDALSWRIWMVGQKQSLVINRYTYWRPIYSSDSSKRRAAESGMQDVPLSQIASQASLMLSILPPSNAFSFAELFLRESKSSNRSISEPLIFVDCNAVNPATVKRIAGKYFHSPSVDCKCCNSA